MEKEYKLLTRPYWPCLFSSANDEQKIINNLSSTTTSLSPTITNHKTKQMSSPITNDNLNKLLDEQRVYEYRAFSSDIIRTIGKDEKYITGFKRVGAWIDVGDGWVCWRLSAGSILLLEPVTFIFHDKIKEMGAKLNIRRHPASTSDVLETVDSDIIFKAIAIKDDWLQINLTQTMNLYKKRKKNNQDEVDNNNNDRGSINEEMNDKKVTDNIQNGENVSMMDDTIEDDIIGYVLMRTPDFELLVEKKFQFNWVVEEAGLDDEIDSLSDKSSPSRSPSFDLRSSPITTYNAEDERPLPTTLKKMNSNQNLQNSPSSNMTSSPSSSGANKNNNNNNTSPLLSIGRKQPVHVDNNKNNNDDVPQQSKDCTNDDGDESKEIEQLDEQLDVFFTENTSSPSSNNHLMKANPASIDTIITKKGMINGKFKVFFNLNNKSTNSCVTNRIYLYYLVYSTN